MNRLQGKVAIITGGAGGLGAQHARQFVAEGASVLITDIHESEGKALAEELGARARFTRQDVSSKEDWKRVVQEAEEAFGKVDVLVNNAGIVLYKTFEEMTLEEYQQVIAVNQNSVFLGIKYVTPAMRRAGGGSIINTSSIAGLRGSPLSAAYASSKFAVRGLSQSAALELTADNIRVNSVHPGAIETPMLVQEDTKASVDEFAKTIPMKRIGRPEEISNMVVFLASDESSYCTGAEFVVDGGATAKL